MDAALSAPSRSFIVSAIKSSIGYKFISSGRSLHAFSLKIGFLTETLLCNHLINMYAKCQSLDDAHKLFDEMPERNMISYSILLSSNSRSGNPKLALRLFSQLQSLDLAPNQFVFSSSIAACSKLGSLGYGEQIHAQVIASGFGSDPFVSTSLVDMYSKLGGLDLAVFIFKQSRTRDPVLFNSMLSGYVSFGAHEEAVIFFSDERRIADCKPTEFNYGILVKACSDLNEETGMQFHGLILKHGFNSDCFVGTSLIDMYGRFELVESLEKAFEDVVSRDIATYNAMIGGLSRNELNAAALDRFGELLFEGFVPNECTLAGALKSCAGLRSCRWGRTIHAIAEKSDSGGHFVVKTAIIDMYMKCGEAGRACRIFDTMADRNAVSYNSMIFGFGQNGVFDRSVSLFMEMKESLSLEIDSSTYVALMSSCLDQRWAVYGDALKHGFGSDLMIRNALLNSLIKNGSADEARQFFDQMLERDVVSWTIIISGLSQMELHGDSVEAFKEMRASGIAPNSFTCSSVLKACASMADAKQGRSIHGCGIKYGVTDEFTNSALLDMYAKCGVLEDGRKLFDGIVGGEIVAWNTMIAAYAQHGRGREAVELYSKMLERNLEPNQVTFVSLLAACSHCYMLEDGVRLFEAMVSKHGIVPILEHYACMVYLFGRAGLLDRAKAFIDAMPFEAGPAIWTVFLAGCKLHGKVELAEMARKKIEGLICEDNSTLVAVSNMFSEVGRWDDAEKARGKIGAARGARKDVGLSWVQNRETCA